MRSAGAGRPNAPGRFPVARRPGRIASMFVRRVLFASLVCLFSTTACASGGIPYDPDDPRLDMARLESSVRTP